MTATPRSSTARPGRSRSQRARRKRTPARGRDCRRSLAVADGRGRPEVGGGRRRGPLIDTFQEPVAAICVGPVGGSACETDRAECATWISFGSRSSSTLTIRSRLVDGGPRHWAGLSWATPRTGSRSGRLRIGCRACCSCRFRRRRQARTDSILTSVRSIKPQKSNVSFPSVLGGTIEHPARPPQVVTTQKPLDNRAEAGAPKLGCLVLATIRARPRPCQPACR
jgi:hypothetical protein